MNISDLRVEAGDTTPVEVAAGLFAQSPVHVSATVDGIDVHLLVVAEASVGTRAGRFVCAQVRVSQNPNGPEITSERLRKVPVAWLTRQAADHVMELHDSSTGETGWRLLTDESRARIRQDGPTAETLAWVAYLYRLAAVTREPPTKAVQDALGVPRSTAGRWVSIAREQGYLGAAAGPGRSGG